MRSTSSITACFWSAIVSPSRYSPARDPGPLPMSTEAAGCELRRFQARSQQAAHHVIGEQLHAAVGVMDDEELLGAKQLVTDNQGTNGIIAGAAAGIAIDVRITFGEAGLRGGIEPGVHARENGKPACRRKSELAPIAEVGGVFAIGLEYFSQDLAHGVSLSGWVRLPE